MKKSDHRNVARWRRVHMRRHRSVAEKLKEARLSSEETLKRLHQAERFLKKTPDFEKNLRQFIKILHGTPLGAYELMH